MVAVDPNRPARLHAAIRYPGFEFFASLSQGRAEHRGAHDQ